MSGLLIPSDELLSDVGSICTVCETVSEDQLPAFESLLKPENDPRTWGLKAERQTRNDCQANSGTSAVEVIEFRTKGIKAELSRMFWYQQCEILDRSFGQDRGTTIAAGAKVALEIGVPLESEYPYTRYTRDRRQFDRWVQPVLSSAATRRIKGVAPLPDWSTMLAHVALGHPVHWGTHWSLNFSKETETGRRIARRYFPHGNSGHAHMIVWATRLRSGEWVAIVWNSHGDEYFLITQEFYEEARNPRNNPYGGYIFLGEDKPIERFYSGEFDVMG